MGRLEYRGEHLVDRSAQKGVGGCDGEESPGVDTYVYASFLLETLNCVTDEYLLPRIQYRLGRAQVMG